MWPVASFPQSFPKTFFGKPQSSLLTGSRSCQVSNGIKGSNATDYAGLRLDCTGGPAILFPFFAQSAEEPFFGSGDNLPFLISPAPIQFGGDITCFDVPIAYMELVLFVLFYFVPVVSA